MTTCPLKTFLDLQSAIKLNDATVLSLASLLRDKILSSIKWKELGQQYTVATTPFGQIRVHRQNKNNMTCVLRRNNEPSRILGYTYTVEFFMETTFTCEKDSLEEAKSACENEILRRLFLS